MSSIYDPEPVYVRINDAQILVNGQGIVYTSAVETGAGWLGQIKVDGKIVWETEPRDARENAEKEAYEKVTGTIAALFVS